MRISDWSSDVCSSDLLQARALLLELLDPVAQHLQAGGGHEVGMLAHRPIELRLRRAAVVFLHECAGHLKPPSSPKTKTGRRLRSEEHTSELQSLMRSYYAVFCLQKPIISPNPTISITHTSITHPSI